MASMVAIYAIASVSVALVTGLAFFPSLGGWAVPIAWIAANVVAAGIAVARSATRSCRGVAATDRMVADLRSVLAAAQPQEAAPETMPQADRRVA